MSYKAIAIAALMLGGVSAAHATVTNSFDAGVSGFQTGDTHIADFDTTFGGAVLVAPAGYYTGLTAGVAAPPAGDTSQYLAVQNGGSATFSFDAARRISFDVGSVDDFNSVTLTLLGSGGPVTLSGSALNHNAATGDQFSNLTNGRLTIFGDAGEAFTGLVLSSSGNSFEVDNLATSGAVPEASTWAMFLGGFGALGSAMRRRRQAVSFA
jgi:hypothetical protein